MSRPIISVNKVSKRYILRQAGAARPGGVDFSIRSALSEAASSAAGRLTGRRPRGAGTSEFWALRDAEFEVEKGKVVGLIGRNGAGKSTLLKIMSRIVEPTSGEIAMRGRVASLLEVGTGFHFDLSGRENIYLNGAILGMKRAEIARKFDEIVAFSEVEKFLDTPVKRYSSGMFVRLAFAVAAHLEPEILIIDEVLAVGDYAFQKKCLGKMRDVATGEGRTVLFVSHHLGALAQLCDQGVMLQHGRVAQVGPIQDVIRAYMKATSGQASASASFDDDPSKPAQFRGLELLHADGGGAVDFSCDEPIVLRFSYEVRRPVRQNYLSFYINTADGVRILYSNFRDLNPEHLEALQRPGLHTFEVVVPPRLLGGGTYQLSLDSSAPFMSSLDLRADCCEFTVRDLTIRDEARPGLIGALIPWSHRLVAEGGPAEPATAAAGHGG